MKFEWILLAFFLVALIWGIVKAIKRPMLKNIFRLASVPVAFLITFLVQSTGVFQQLAGVAVDFVNLAAMIPGLTNAMGFIKALAATIAGPFVFVLIFFICLIVLRFIIFIAFKIADKSNAKKAEKAALAAQVSSALEEAAEETSVEEAVAESEEAPAVDGEAQAAEDAVVAQEAPIEESPAPELPKEEAPTKKKKTGLPDECAWKRVVSIATGAISGLLILAVVLMPIFYLMSIVTTAVEGIENSDADDSQIYQIVSVVDEYIAEPYEGSFTASFYDTLGISGLMNSVTREAGKMTLDNGKTVYADDVLKSLLKHGVSAATQITSAKSKYLTIEEDLGVLVSDPLISSVLADLVIMGLDGLEITEPEEDDIIGGLTNTFLEHYKEAEREVIEKDLQVVGKTVAALAKSGVLIQLVGGNADFEELLADEENLGNVVGSISGLSAFTPTIEGAFGLGVDLLGTTLNIPENDAEVYESFMTDLAAAMQKSSTTAFDYNTIRSYIVNCANQNKKVSSNNGIKGHSQFVAYVAHWEKIQAVFSHAAEDTSYGYFTLVINSKTYIYDKSTSRIVIYDDSTKEQYKDKVSPLAGVINVLTLNSTSNQPTRDKIYAILESYVASTNDEVSKEVATRILAKDAFVSKAVTMEKMRAATNFSDWTEAEREADSKLCVSIIMKLMGLMDSLGSTGSMGDINAAKGLVDQFVVLGETMDLMKQTSCIGELPPLLLEGIIKNEMLKDYMSPAIAFQVNAKVAENKTYTECMRSIAGILKWAIENLGSMGGV